MNKCIAEIVEQFYIYKEKKNIEIEARLGFFNIGKFDSNITEFFFNKIKEKFDNTKTWINVEKISKTDYYYNKIRISIEDDGTTECIEKKRFKNLDYEIDDSPLDFRISFSQENNVPNKNYLNKDNLFTRVKNRTRYEHNSVYFDLTEVITENNSVSETRYEIEIELKKNDKSCLYNSINLVLKALDLVNICETISKNPNIISI